jgi:hypothetical protein
MDLKTFVEESLSQIVSGIKAAQARPDGEFVASEMYGSGSNLIQGGTSGMFTPVEFDVSVTAETKEGGNSIRVASTEVKDAAERSAQNSSRVKFTVHVRIPEGSKAPRSRQSNSSSSYRPDIA